MSAYYRKNGLQYKVVLHGRRKIIFVKVRRYDRAYRKGQKYYFNVSSYWKRAKYRK